MLPPGYPAWVKTIEAIRMANFQRLIAELQEGDASLRPPEIAKALGISTVYRWQLEKGERNSINSKAARKIERSMNKPEGWMDTDFDLWPFPDVELLTRVERLGREQRIEVQAAIRRALSDFEQKTAVGSGKSSPSQNGSSGQRAA